MHDRLALIGRQVTIRDSGTVRVFDCVGTSDVMEDCALLMVNGKFHSKTVPFARLEPVKTQEERTPENRAGYLMLDFRTSRDEATEWMAFCLLQAAVLFQNVPDGRKMVDVPGPESERQVDETRDELIRILTIRGLREDGPEVTAALAFYDQSLWYADKLKEEQGD